MADVNRSVKRRVGLAEPGMLLPGSGGFDLPSSAGLRPAFGPGSAEAGSAFLDPTWLGAGNGRIDTRRVWLELKSRIASAIQSGQINDQVGNDLLGQIEKHVSGALPNDGPAIKLIGGIVDRFIPGAGDWAAKQIAGGDTNANDIMNRNTPGGTTPGSPVEAGPAGSVPGGGSSPGLPSPMPQSTGPALESPHDGTTSPAATPEGVIAPRPATTPSSTDDISALIHQFYDRMMAGWDDPYWKQQHDDIANYANQKTLSEMAERGIRGGLAGSSARDRVRDTLSGDMSRRQGLAAQSLGLMNQRDLGQQGIQAQLAALSQQGQQWQLDRQDAFNLGNYQNNTGFGAALGYGLGSIISPALGYVGGFVGGQLGGGGSLPQPAQPSQIYRGTDPYTARHSSLGFGGY